jgi:hypothetical protein
VINKTPCDFRNETGEEHSLPVDGFFNPSLGAGVCFMPRDFDGVFRWYHVGKNETGGSYALEFLPQTVKPGEKWQCVPVVVAVLPGDWRDQWRVYRDWVKSWFKPLVPRKQWFREVFSFADYSPRARKGTPLDRTVGFLALAQRREARLPGSTDYLHLFGWAITDEYGHWGAYDHYDQLGGKERFVKEVRRCQEAGIPVGLYLDCYLVSTKSDKPPKEDVEKWSVRKEDGAMLYHEQYDAHSMCPYVLGWRNYLTAVYQRVAHDIKPSGMYLDEYGKCMTSRICYSRNHGHPAPMGMCSGEWILTKQIRQAVPPEIATYCEYVPADVACQFIDGAFGHVPLYGHRDGYDKIAPHYVNLQRFAIPDFKTFQLIYYTPLRNGNWFLLKYPFFDGDGYYLTDAEMEGYDEHARAFLARVFKIQHEHKDAFTSADVEPLVQTELPGLYVNRFSTPKKNVWTLFNANYRSLRGNLLVLPQRPGARYFDAWNEKPIQAEVKDGAAHVPIELGPRGVGCVVQLLE